MQSWEKIYKPEKKMLEARNKAALEDSCYSGAGCVAVAMRFILCKTKGLNSPFSKYITSIKVKMLDLIQFSFILAQFKQLLEI